MKIYWSILLFIICSSSLLAQQNWYVGQGGSDASGNGQSPAQAFATIDYAQNFLEAGDTLFVLPGTYQNEAFGDGNYWRSDNSVTIQDLHGNEQAYIVIKPLEAGSVTFHGDGTYIFLIRNSSYLRVEGFEVEGEVNNIPLALALEYQFAYREDGSDEILYRVAPGTPPEVVEQLIFEPLTNIDRPSYFDTKGLVTVLSHHIDIINNYVHHMPGTGIRFRASGYFRAIGNEVHDCSRRSYSGTHALVVDSSDDIDNSDEVKVIIERNHVHHNYNEMYSWAPTKTIITPVIDEGKGISLQRNDVENGWLHGRILVRNNLTHNNGYSGLHSNNGRGIDFINNTSYHDHFTGLGNNHGISLQATDDVRIINNIVVNDPDAGGFGMAASSSSFNYEVSNNLVFGTIDSDIAAVATQTLLTDPLFVDPAAFNFQLQFNSPAIGAALAAVTPTGDFQGFPRDDQPDLGAFEYNANGPVAVTFTSPFSVNIYPNPCSNWIVLEGFTGQVKHLFLTDLTGRKYAMPMTSIGTNKIQIDLRSLPAGLFFLSDSVHTFPVVKG